ncbi:hypothetical protein BGY98DRAFT_1014373 [Russula aff. rugulosa BPL654]|nr:hypothetical protein BGY98DRAFT_1014373 [Russula aff. rugulosa BPL654]
MRRNAQNPDPAKSSRTVRLFLFVGAKFYKVHRLAEIALALLHLSVYLFFAGLVIIFHTINTKVAVAVDIPVGLYGLAYIMLSILPCLDFRCPYITPMSSILWYPFHIFSSFTTRCLYGLVKQLHGCFVEPGLDGTISSPWQRKLVDWLYSHGKAIRKAIRKHWRCVMDGFGKSVIKAAINRQEVEHEMIASLLTMFSLNDKSKFREFAASIPRYRIPALIEYIRFEKIGILDPLLFFRGFVAGAPTTGHDEDVRKRSFLACLDAIHHTTKTPDIPELNFVRANFANIGHMRTLWEDSDTTIRVKSRSICALIARQVGRRDWIEEEELVWLQDVTGETSHEILNADVETRDWMNFKSFVYGVLSNQVGDLPMEDATSFRETLAILLDVRTDPRFDLPSSQNQLFEKVSRMYQDDPRGSHYVVRRLLSIFPFIPPPFPVPIIPSVSLPPLPTDTHTP